ncbi:MAG: HlyC/CorC family transporter [Gemmatimonadales bacterium]|nr:MAG: HlyC/CorC family transporter [Gemmatimonadales bacterium]
MTPFLLPVAGLLLLLSALLSAADSAAAAVGASRMRTLLEEGFRRAEPLQEVRERSAAVRAAAFLAATTLNATIAGLITAWAALEWGPMGALGGLLVALALLVLLAEGAPRFLAGRAPIRMALFSAPLLLRLEAVTRPVLSPFVRLDELLARRNGESVSADEREVRELAELGRREGVVDEEEHELVERAFRMDELAAYDIMTPRVDIFAWPDSLTLERIIPQLRKVPFSRIPVYGEGIDDITGVLYVREAYEAYISGRADMRLSELSRDPFFLPGSLSLPRLLKDFQARRLHMGIVADEFGGTDGLVTLEDVLEELVGEIEDELDISEENLVRVSRTEIEVDGGIELREVNYVFNVSLPHLDHRSLNGLVLEELGHVPVAGETLELPGLEIEVLDATDTQVTRARLRKTHALGTEDVGR